MPSISITPQHFKAGCASSPYSDDGGFSPSMKGHNIDYQKGVIAPNDTPVKIADLVADYNGAFLKESSDYSILASIKSDGKLKVDRYQAGGLSATQSEATEVYSPTLGGIGFVGDSFYISCLTDITRLNKSFTGGFYVSWWDDTMAMSPLVTGVPHHFANLGNDLYVTDYASLHKITNSTTTTPNILQITGGLSFTAICENDDKLYLATEFQNLTSKGGYYLMAWDGNAAQTFDFKIPVDEKIYTLVSYLGYIYAFTEKWFCRWNGLYLEKIRPLNGPVYPNQIAKANGNLYFIGGNETTAADNTKCIQVFNGSAFYYLYSSTTAITALGNIFGDDLAFCTNEDLNKIDLNDRVGDGKFATLPIDFVGNVYIRKITVEFAENMASGNVNTFKIYDQTGTPVDTLVASFALDTGVSFKEFKGLDYKNLNSLVIKGDTFNNLIRRITIYYEPNNMPL